MKIDKQAALVVLECMKTASDEGWHLDGYYGSKMSMEQIKQLGKELCEFTGLDVSEREWLK